MANPLFGVMKTPLVAKSYIPPQQTAPYAPYAPMDYRVLGGLQGQVQNLGRGLGLALQLGSGGRDYRGFGVNGYTRQQRDLAEILGRQQAREEAEAFQKAQQARQQAFSDAQAKARAQASQAAQERGFQHQDAVAAAKAAAPPTPSAAAKAEDMRRQYAEEQLARESRDPSEGGTFGVDEDLAESVALAPSQRALREKHTAETERIAREAAARAEQERQAREAEHKRRAQAEADRNAAPPFGAKLEAARQNDEAQLGMETADPAQGGVFGVDEDLARRVAFNPSDRTKKAEAVAGKAATRAETVTTQAVVRAQNRARADAKAKYGKEPLLPESPKAKAARLAAYDEASHDWRPFYEEEKAAVEKELGAPGLGGPGADAAGGQGGAAPFFAASPDMETPGGPFVASAPPAATPPVAAAAGAGNPSGGPGGSGAAGFPGGTDLGPAMAPVPSAAPPFQSNVQESPAFIQDVTPGGQGRRVDYSNVRDPSQIAVDLLRDKHPAERKMALHDMRVNPGKYIARGVHLPDVFSAFPEE